MLDYRELIRFSEKQLELADESLSSVSTQYIVSSTILSWIAIESFMNNMLDDFADLPDGMFQLHEVAFMRERQLDFLSEGNAAGTFTVNEKRRNYRRLEEKISFLLAKFGKKSDYRGEDLWQKFVRFREVRNSLVHPRKNSGLNVPTVDEAREYLDTSRALIRFVSTHVWSRPVEF